MAPGADRRRASTCAEGLVRYPAWYPWFLRSDEDLLDLAGDHDPAAVRASANKSLTIVRRSGSLPEEGR